MNAIDLLKDDHREVERLFAKFLAAEVSDTRIREDLFHHIETELLLHGDVEERVFYPAVGDFIPDKVEEALNEHAQINQVLADLTELNLDDDAFDPKMVTLMETVVSHVQEEESSDGILGLAQQKLDDARLEQLARQIQALKRSFPEELAA
jgi:hemerythrin superfamily protein